jgi:hypothetical protein
MITLPEKDEPKVARCARLSGTSLRRTTISSMASRMAPWLERLPVCADWTRRRGSACPRWSASEVHIASAASGRARLSMPGDPLSTLPRRVPFIALTRMCWSKKSDCRATPACCEWHRRSSRGGTYAATADRLAELVSPSVAHFRRDAFVYPQSDLLAPPDGGPVIDDSIVSEARTAVTLFTTFDSQSHGVRKLQIAESRDSSA